MSVVEIPNRSLFRQPEVCEIAQLQPYVLRSWEAEFPDLGVIKGAVRVYRKVDLERVLRIKHLLFVEGLTLAGARRKLMEEQAPAASEPAAFDELLSNDARERIRSVRQTLRELSAMLDGRPAPAAEEFALAAPGPGARGRAKPIAVKKPPARAAKRR